MFQPQAGVKDRVDAELVWPCQQLQRHDGEHLEKAFQSRANRTHHNKSEFPLPGIDPLENNWTPQGSNLKSGSSEKARSEIVMRFIYEAKRPQHTFSD